MRVWVLILIGSAGLAGQDAREIVRRSIELDRKNLELSRSYTFLQREQHRDIETGGRVKKVESDTYDVTLLEGSPYKRHIAHDERPLSEKEQAKEAENLRKSIEDRRRETPEQRAARIRDWDDKRAKQREPLKEIPDAFDLKITGEEKMEGRDVWVIDATPRPGYRPRNPRASFFPKVKARFWIARQDYQCVKMEMESLDTISFGGILVRMAKGAHLEFEQTRVNDEVWLPKRIVLKGAVRIALVKMIRGDISFDYSNYKKFQVDSRVVTTGQ
jgi:hypothetical protein